MRRFLPGLLDGAFRRRFGSGFLGRLRLPGAFLALGGDAFKQLGGGFVLLVLRQPPGGDDDNGNGAVV